MFETLLVPFLFYLIASSSVPDHFVNWFSRFMPGGRKFASLKAGCPPTLRSLQTCRSVDMKDMKGSLSRRQYTSIKKTYFYRLNINIFVFGSMIIWTYKTILYRGKLHHFQILIMTHQQIAVNHTSHRMFSDDLWLFFFCYVY